jgi:excisionase family DNA binding protein
MAEERLAYRINEAAATLGISRSKAYGLINAGKLPVIRIGATMRIPAEALREWVRKQARRSA